MLFIQCGGDSQRQEVQWGAEGMPDLQGAQEQGSALSGTQAREEPLAPVPRLIQVSLWSLILPTFPGKCVSKTL